MSSLVIWFMFYTSHTITLVQAGMHGLLKKLKNRMCYPKILYKKNQNYKLYTTVCTFMVIHVIPPHASISLSDLEYS